MENKKSIKKNYIYNLTYQILIMLLPLVVTPYVSRVLGANNIGIYSYTVSIATYFITLGSLGIALYGQREIAYCQNDKKKYSKIFYEIILLRFITLFISLFVFYLAFVVRNNSFNIYYKVLILEIIANMLDISWFFMGLEDFKKTVGRNLIVKLISVLSIFMFVKTSNDLMIYFLIYVLSILIGNISLWLYLPKYLTIVKVKSINLIRHLKPTLALFIPQIAIQVYTLLDKTMIGFIIADKSEVGFYEQSSKIIKLLLTIITSMGTVMMPRIANSFATAENDKIKKYVNKSFNMVFFFAFPLIFGLISVSDVFVPIFFGDGYEKVSLLMKIIAPIILFIGLSNVTGTQFLLPTKRQSQFTKSVLCGAFVNFIINILLIPKYGALGASIGTVVAELVVTTVQLHFVKNDFELSEIIKSSIMYFFASLFMFVFCLFLSLVIKNGIVSIILQVVTGAIIYISTLVVLKNKFVLDFIYKILNKIIKEN